MPPCRWIDPGPTGLCTFVPPTSTIAEVPVAEPVVHLPRTGGGSVVLVAAVACVAAGSALRRIVRC